MMLEGTTASVAGLRGPERLVPGGTTACVAGLRGPEHMVLGQVCAGRLGLGRLDAESGRDGSGTGGDRRAVEDDTSFHGFLSL